MLPAQEFFKDLLKGGVIERAVAALGRISTVILCEAVDPTLLLSQAEGTRFVAPDLPGEAMGVLDGLLEG